jgi:iron complex outermembrane receptor protein
MRPEPSRRPTTLLLLLPALLAWAAPGDALGQAAGTLSGRVVFAGGGAADDAELRIQTLARRALVDAEGFFTFPDLPPGSHLLEATSARYGRGVTRVEIRPGVTTTITLELDPLFRLDELVISAGPLSARRSETYQPSSALTGLNLARAARSSLGETLAGEPGVAATYNGPGASRPLIRGLGGDRVRILEASIGSGDVSNQGPDHAVGVDPLAADRIEIVRGPATLLYGGGAVGGVVNVFDGRVPREALSSLLTGSVTALGGTVADERTGAFALNGALRGGWAWHLGGLRRSTGDARIPGHAEHEHEEEAEPGEEAEGILENSAVETTRGALGLSWIAGSGFLGVSLSGLDTDYGVPGHGHARAQAEEGEPHEEEDVVIGLRQRRVDLEGELRFEQGIVKAVKARFGAADYRHTEFEGEEVGTRFTNQQWEGRLEMTHSLLESVSGAAGLQVMGRDFAARGGDAFVPPSHGLTVAGFMYQEIDRGPLRFQVGARAEGQRMARDVGGLDRDHVGLSVSAGMSWTLPHGLGLALSAGRSVKLPTLEELFSDGPHAATFAFEVGDPFLDREAAYTVDATLRLTEGRLRGEVTGYRSFFDGFIYQAFTGEEEDGLPVLRFGQSDAVFVGFESALELSLVHRGRHHLLWEGWGDYVRAELPSLRQDLPRIPPLRAGTRMRYDGGTLRGEMGITRVARQDRVAPFEEATEGYTSVDSSVGYRLFRGDLVHDLILQGANLTNEEARLHTSFLKELAPLPGREIRLLYRIYF